MRLTRTLFVIVGLLLAFGLSSCRDCSEDHKRPEEFLGPDYWPLYGTWRLEDVRIDAYENSSGPESGYMHDITWNADGTFVVEWANDIIQVGHVEKIVESTILPSGAFLITVELESDCPKKNPWFCGEYTVTAGTVLLMTGFSFPWGSPGERKGLGYERL